MNRCKVAIITAAALLFAITPAKAEEVVNRVVAVVGDDVVTSMDLEKYVKMVRNQFERLQAARGGSTAEAALPSPSEIRRLAIERMVDDKIFDLEVKAQGLQASDQEIDHYIQRIKDSGQMTDKDFLARLNMQGMTLEEYKDQLRQDILKQRLIAQAVKARVVISDVEVEKFYQEHNTQAARAGQVSLRAMFLTLPEGAPPAEIEVVRQQMEGYHQAVTNGEDFAKIAKEHSQGPGAAQGGVLGPLATGDLLPAMRQALLDLQPGQISPVIRIPNGFVFMQLLSASEAEAEDNKELKEQIRSKLEKEAMDQRFIDWLKEIRGKYYVKIVEN
ncbi:MAG: SurA N-terminal domain-containing protein [Deltaproteobacteria bacterium]|nr:SurA N-terminal domain-containing protein [Deltaproteobacteria bacterium]